MYFDTSSILSCQELKQFWRQKEDFANKVAISKCWFFILTFNSQWNPVGEKNCPLIHDSTERSNTFGLNIGSSLILTDPKSQFCIKFFLFFIRETLEEEPWSFTSTLILKFGLLLWNTTCLKWHVRSMNFWCFKRPGILLSFVLLASVLNALMRQCFAPVLIATSSVVALEGVAAEMQQNNSKREGFRRFSASLHKKREEWLLLVGVETLFVYLCVQRYTHWQMKPLERHCSITLGILIWSRARIVFGESCVTRSANPR